MVGFTSCIPLEILIAAGREPLDLERHFLSADNPRELVEEADVTGFPPDSGCLLRGIYGAALQQGVREIVVVTSEEDSGNRALMEILQLHGTRVIPFAYPFDRSADSLAHEIKKLARHFHASAVDINQVRQRLNKIRRKVQEIDRLCWQENRVGSLELYRFQADCADMRGNPDEFEREIDSFLARARKRSPRKETLRLALLGAPPLANNLLQTLEELDARVVFNERPRQVTFPQPGDSLVEQYLHYTTPYDVITRLEEIEQELDTRQVDGVIHVLHAGSCRQVEDAIIRRRLNLPLLTLSGSRPGPVDAHTRAGLETFLQSLKQMFTPEARQTG